MKIYKTFEEWSGACHLFNSHEDRNLKLFQAGQSWPNDKIGRALEVLNKDKYCGGSCMVCEHCSDFRINDAIKILEEKDGSI